MLASKLASKGLLCLSAMSLSKFYSILTVEVLKYSGLGVNLPGLEVEFGIDNGIGIAR